MGWAEEIFLQLILPMHILSATESVRQLGGYIAETPELARKMARASDARRAEKANRSPRGDTPGN